MSIINCSSPAIYIYAGETIQVNNKSISYEGVSVDGVKNLVKLFREIYPYYPIYEVETNQMKPDMWATGSILVLPGGMTRQWRWIHQEELVKNVRQFVEKGGKVIGFCAGAYACCEEIEYTDSNNTLIKAKYGLNFFPGKGIGPLKDDNQPIPGTRLNARAVSVKWECTGQTGYLTLNGGGYFLPRENESFEVLARYEGVARDQSIAGVKMKIGEQGIVKLFFPHPEYGSEDYPINLLKTLYQHDPHILENIQKTYQHLKEGYFFQKICFKELVE